MVSTERRVRAERTRELNARLSTDALRLALSRRCVHTICDQEYRSASVWLLHLAGIRRWSRPSFRYAGC